MRVVTEGANRGQRTVHATIDCFLASAPRADGMRVVTEGANNKRHKSHVFYLRNLRHLRITSCVLS
jgi:hypothetical protein